MNEQQGEHRVQNERMSRSMNNSSGGHQRHLAGFLLGSYFFKRDSTGAEHFLSTPVVER